MGLQGAHLCYNENTKDKKTGTEEKNRPETLSSIIQAVVLFKKSNNRKL